MKYGLIIWLFSWLFVKAKSGYIWLNLDPILAMWIFQTWQHCPQLPSLGDRDLIRGQDSSGLAAKIARIK